ncbi:hypothetical protein L1887_32209 [Cichorium endivia]|nr:hypothetical protein L1887_32209 [Cichorium endivia]
MHLPNMERLTGLNCNFSAPYTPQQNGVVGRRGRQRFLDNKILITGTKPSRLSERLLSRSKLKVIDSDLLQQSDDIRRPNSNLLMVYAKLIKQVLKNGVEEKLQRNALSWVVQGAVNVVVQVVGCLFSSSDSQDSKAYRVMNKRTQKIEETFNLTFDDYYIKKSLHPFPMSSIFPKPAVDAVPITTFDTEFTLLFDPPVRAVDSEARAADNDVSELSKLTDGPDDSSTSSVQRPSSVEGEPSNRSEGNSSVEREPNNSPTSPPQEISNIMSLYPSV